MDKYFNDIFLLQNTLLPYFYDQYPLISLNRKFYKLDYEKYNTHLQPHGTVTIYYPMIIATHTEQKGKIIDEMKNYKNGLLDGLYEKYYRDATLCKKYSYKNGLLDGLYQHWDTNNELHLECTYKNELLDGLYQQYKYNKLSIKRNYKNGFKNGLSEQWYPDGRLWKKNNYKNDLLDGLSEEWYKNGQLHIKKNYKNNYCIIHKEWCPNGQLKF